MTTELVAAEVTRHLQAWANGLQEAAQLNRRAIQDGDPDGHGIDYLTGKAVAYEDAARALQDHVNRIRGDEVPPRRLVICR